MSCLRPSKTSRIVIGPLGPMTSMVASTSTMGSRRRAAAIASPSRVCAFSRANNASRASCQVFLSTTGGRAGLGAWSFMIASMRSLRVCPPTNGTAR
jgi:hypothetical protein